MKLKYKKIILLTTMSTMGIGLLTLSLSNDKSDAKESINQKAEFNTVMSEDTAVEDELTDAQLAATVTGEPLVSPTPTVVPTPTPLPVYPIEDEGYPKITKLVKEYYAAKNNRDVEALKALLSNPSEADTQEELQQKTEYIDEYLNIKAYVKKSSEKDSYIVYVYHEIKFTSINTPAPGLAKFYVITDAAGNLKIFSGAMDEENQAYYDQRDSDQDVIDLIKMTDEKSDKAIESDEDLLNFWKNIDEMAANTEDAQPEGDTN